MYRLALAYCLSFSSPSSLATCVYAFVTHTIPRNRNAHACAPSHARAQATPTGGEADVLLARGVPIKEELTSGFATRQWLMLAGVLALDVLTLCAAIWLFLVSRSVLP
jgi:hypothetical protein